LNLAGGGVDEGEDQKKALLTYSSGFRQTQRLRLFIPRLLA